MPVSGCMAVLEFLDIVDAGIMPVDFNGDDNATAWIPKSIPRDSSNEAVDRAQEIAALTATCLTCLLRAETSGILSQKLGLRQFENENKTIPNTGRSASMPNSAPFLEPLLPASISEGLKAAMHSALKNVMTDRDDAQASLIASSVLHVHEIERERKKGELAMKKLQVVEAHLKRQQQGGLFAERFKDPRIEDSKNVQKSLEEMLKGSEEEINELCKQLAKEVAEKTAAKLEIYRLQEIANHLRASDSAEKKALEDELRKVRAELAEAKKKSPAKEDEVKRLNEGLEARAGLQL
jgi:vacuolar-type H+-ATPase subunit I/STV1